jgi:signal peptidase I
MQIDLTKLDPPTEGEPAPAPKKAPLVNVFSVVLMLVLLFLVFFYFNFQTVVVTGHSMEPTFHDKQRIAICKALWLVGGIQRGNIVVIRRDVDNEYLVKRVAYLAGDEVDTRNQPVNWDTFKNGAYKVPKDCVYVLGDNEEISEDSRVFGPVPMKDIVGKVFGS